MQELRITTNPAVELVFGKYPEHVRKRMLSLRELIIGTAGEIDALNELEETLKWGEPSYLTKHGSTLRMDWKPRAPDQSALYFKCTSRLVETFKVVYKNDLTFEGNRAIVLDMQSDIPKEELKCCIKAALTYHKVKHLPRLGL